MHPNLSREKATPLTDSIIETYQHRTDLHRAEKRLTLQGKALCRRLSQGDKTAGTALWDRVAKGDETAMKLASLTALPDIMAAKKAFEAKRKEVEKALTKLAKKLPVYPWADSVKGISPLGLALIVGEAGNLARFPKPSLLWKRFGLAVIDGERQGFRSDAEENIRHGYCAPRRAVAWNVGNGLAKQKGEYYELYLERKELEIGKAVEAGLIVAPSAEIPKKDAKKYRSAGHVHNRALRYMTKRFFLNLWVAWVGAEEEGEEGEEKAA